MSTVFRFRYDLTDLTDENIGECAYEYYVEDGMEVGNCCSVYAENFNLAKDLAKSALSSPIMNELEKAAVGLIDNIPALIEPLPQEAKCIVNHNVNGVMHQIRITMYVSIASLNSVI